MQITHSRRPDAILSPTIAALLLCTQFFLSGCSSSIPAHAETSKDSALKRVDEKNLPVPQLSEDGSLAYTVQRGDSTLSLARKYLSQSSLMTVAELDAAIRNTNSLTGKRGTLKPGQSLAIPSIEKQPIIEKSRQVPRDTDLRAVYLTGTMAGSVKGMQIVSRWRELGGNAVVFDIKDSDGALSISFDHALALKRRPSISNLPKFARYLHSQNMHAIARIALFRDENIAQNHHELAVRSRATGQPWKENG